jgi:hypothetical protein
MNNQMLKQIIRDIIEEDRYVADNGKERIEFEAATYKEAKDKYPDYVVYNDEDEDEYSTIELVKGPNVSFYQIVTQPSGDVNLDVIFDSYEDAVRYAKEHELNLQED